MSRRQANHVTAAHLPGLADLVRRHDPDRYFCTLFAPAARQSALFTLYAFNHELARAHEAAREPGLALIRLQWWREIVEGAYRAHEVATPLSAALADGTLSCAPLLAMIEAREAETEPAATTAILLERLSQGAGTLAATAGAILGAAIPAQARLRQLGTGIALAGLIRNIPAHARQGRSQIPADLGPDPTPDAIAALTARARSLLGQPERHPKSSLAAGLAAVLARRDLARPLSPRPRGIGDRVAVLSAMLSGRI